MLLKKGLILVPATIFLMTLCNSNTLYAESITGTKDRIKEIKIVEETNIEKLIRNNKIKLASIYARSEVKATSRNEEERVEKEEVTQETSNITKSKTKTTNTTVKKEATKKQKTKKNEKKETKKVEQKENSIKIKNVKISKNMDLTVRTGLSKEEFKQVMKNLKQDTSGFFYDNADTIYDVCKKYQINEIFFCGLISAESGWNIASNHRRTHNYISLMSNGKLISYSSTKQGLEVAAQKLHYNYLTSGGKFYGGKTLAGVKKKFCPSGTWVDLVYGRMSQVMVAAKKTK